MDPFDPDALMMAATAQVPSADFGPDDFEASFRLFLQALRDEARLNQSGTWAAVARLVQSLKRRRNLSRLLSTHPEIREVPIPAPVVIVGFPRTGTTLLHNLLAVNPRHRAIRLWEMREPFAPEDASQDWVSQTEGLTEQLVQAGYKLSPRLVNIHPLNARWPDECSWLFRNSFATLVNAYSYYIPTYARWVMDRDMTSDYAYYRLQLQAILHQRPGQPLILKDPCHTWHLSELLRVLPDARIIHLHRDISEVAGSFASLCYALQEGTSEVRPMADFGAYATEMLEVGMHRMVQARQTLPADRFLDLSYSELVSDPIQTVQTLHDQLGLVWDDEASAACARWLVESRKHTGRHRYSLESFGMDSETLHRRFAPYLDSFAYQLPKM